MSVNSAWTTDDFLLLHNSSANFSHPFFMYCLTTTPSSFIFMGFIISYTVLLLPLAIYILCHWLQQCWTKLSTSVGAMSHSDTFTYHAVLIKLTGVIGCILSFYGVFQENLDVLTVGVLLASFILIGEAFFHVLTCVERYVAVVHPIIYLNLRNDRGIRIRNISIGCVWLLCFVGMGSLMKENLFTIIDMSLLIIAITIVSFCSISVLCVLIKPGPGEQGGDRERIDQSKQKAFHTIVIILGVLVLRFAWGLVRVIGFWTNTRYICIVMTCGFWFYLPSSLVLPMLFLHRRGTLLGFRK